VLENELDEVDAAAQVRAPRLERREVIAATVRVGRVVAQLERQEGHHTADGLVALGGAVVQQIRVDVVATKLLDAIAQAAPQALGVIRRLLGTKQLGEQITLGGERRAAPIADEALFVLGLAEQHSFALPLRAEQPGVTVLQLGAVALFAGALGHAGAATGPEQVVVAERDEAAEAFFR